MMNNMLRYGVRGVQTRICLLTLVVSTLVALAFGSYEYVTALDAEYGRQGGASAACAGVERGQAGFHVHNRHGNG
jgi:hypothetical protein